MTNPGPHTWMLIAGLIIMLIGIVMVIRAVRGDRARGRRRCPRCWYDMQGASSLRCPECGIEARQERDLQRPRRRWRQAMLGLLLAMLPLAAYTADQGRRRGWIYLVLPKWVVKQEVASGPFRVQIMEARNPDMQGWTRALRVRRDDETLLQLAGIYWTVSQPGDVTGDGVPDVIAVRDSGGTGCYQEHYLLSLDQRARESGLDIIAIGACGSFEDVDGDGIVEFVARDRTYAYRWTSGANSPYPKVVLRLSQGQFVEALELMRTPSLSDEEIDKRIRAFRNEQDSWEGRFAALLDVVLDLIYSGNADQAWHALATRWPQPEEAGITLAEFESELRAALRESPYAAEIEMLNVTGMSHAAQVADQGQLRAANVPANRAALTED